MLSYTEERIMYQNVKLSKFFADHHPEHPSRWEILARAKKHSFKGMEQAFEAEKLSEIFLDEALQRDFELSQGDVNAMDTLSDPDIAAEMGLLDLD